VPAAALSGWLRAEGLLPAGAGPDDLEITQLAGGASNLTFRVQAPGADWVLRRPPVHGALPTAHDVVREYRIQEALAATGVPVAPMVAACADPDVIGAPFYLMRRLDGVIHGEAAGLAALPATDIRKIVLRLVDTLATIHAVRPERTPLRELARPGSFLDRTISRWRRQWELSQVPAHPVPALDALFDLLARRRPADAPVRLVHGDYKLDNVMYAADDQTRVLAVLDWELATLGDALADLGALVMYWGEVGRLMWASRGGHLADANPAMPATEEIVDRYALRMASVTEKATEAELVFGAAPGLPADTDAPIEAALRHLPYYEVLATTKLAVIVAGAARRQQDPTADDATRIWDTVTALAALATARAADIRRPDGE
jgi:aminoglycoside phosphotransferase (APT) family kinase protein